MLIRLLFFEKLQIFFFFFSKSRVRMSSEVQTQTNCYIYAVLLPVISATDLTLENTIVKLRSVYVR